MPGDGKSDRALLGLQDAVDAVQNHDKYLYDQKDFSGQATPPTEPDTFNIETPRVPPNPEEPDKPTMDHLTIDARTKGAPRLLKSVVAKAGFACQAVCCRMYPLLSLKWRDSTGHTSEWLDKAVPLGPARSDSGKQD